MTLSRNLTLVIVIFVSTIIPNTSFAQFEDPLDIGFMLRGAGTHYSVKGEDRVGGTYGFDTTVHLTGRWGLLGSANVNHVNGGTQIAGSLGVVKVPNPRGYGLDAMSFSLLFDQFSDTRIGTFGGDLYLSQLRLQTGYAIQPNMELGAVLSTPLNEDDDLAFFLTQFPGSLPLPGTLTMPNSGNVYLAGLSGSLQWSTNVGYRDNPDTWILGGTMRTKLTERSAGFIGINYEENPSNWTSFVGVELNISRNRSRSRCGPNRCNTVRYCDTGCGVVRAQSPDAYVRQVSNIQEVDGQNSAEGKKLTESEFDPLAPKKVDLSGNGQPQILAQPETFVQPDVFNPQRTTGQQPIAQGQFDQEAFIGPLYFNEEYFDWLGRPIITVLPHQLYAGVGIKCFTGNQAFQKQFTGANLRNPGRILFTQQP